MLMHPTLDKLNHLPFAGMAAALREQLDDPNTYQSLSFEERLGLLLDREHIERENRRLATRLRTAKFPIQACVEDLDFQSGRKLDKNAVIALMDCQWVAQHAGIIITGPTGVGKTYMACALAQKACREGYKALYMRIPRLFRELTIAKADGRFSKLLTSLSKIDVLILDDWGMAPFNKENRRDFLEIFEDRYDRRATIITSQFPSDSWHKLIGDATLADAILDRVLHRAYQLKIEGESMRKKHSVLTKKTPTDS